ncbi:MAG: transglycosylase domain-containing protein, partial [Anaerolineae bacterium]|nr:transglycosylase domain-containing protein [Anaerolineae bacterium]
MTTAAQIIRRRRARKARQQTSRTRTTIGLTLGLLLFGLLVVLPVSVGLGGATLVYTTATRGLPGPSDSQAQGSAALGSTELYDRTGTTLLLADMTGQTNNWIALTDMPAYILRATLRAEDPDFLTLTPSGTVTTFSQLWENSLFGPLAPNLNITGRLVRSVIAPLPEVPTVDDINREIAIVAELEKRYTPQQLLEWHLNTNYYGNSAYGIEAAAQTYLGKSALELTLDEAAMLAAIPLAPQYNPLDNETAARGRQRDLLRAMRTANDITAEEFDIAATTFTTIQVTANVPDQIAPEFIAYARRQAQEILNAQGRNGAQLVARGGLRIITTLDLELHYQAECALETQLARLAGRAISPDAANGSPCITAGYLPLSTAPLAGSAPDQGTLVLLDARTGEILTMIGSATRMNAQPGPTLYPFVYFTSFISAAENPASMVLDIPRQFPGAVQDLIYTPKNPDGIFRGPINLRNAMSSWLLAPAAQIASERGLNRILSLAHRIGLNSLGEDGRFDLSLLERGGQVSVLDMAYAYSVFAALGDMRGIRTEPIGQGYRQANPVAVQRIEDEDGNIIWEYNAAQIAQNQVGIFPHDVGYLINDVLADQVKRRQILGDSVSVLELPRRNAVVNGLAGDRSESWTVGYTPQLVTAVHLHRADGQALTLDPLGTQGAAIVWKAVMQYAHDRASLPADDWPRPEGVITLSICERSGLLPNGQCPTYNELFLSQPGFQPTITDSYWQSVVINSQSGQKATASTPSELRVSTLYFIPPQEAEEWWKANKLPLPPTQFDSVSRPELFNEVQILQPQPYAYVGGQVDIRGTMNTSDMSYFQLSYGQGQYPTSFFQIGPQQREFTPGASLGIWDTTGLSGLYSVLLTVVRQDGTADPANVQVIVDNTPP